MGENRNRHRGHPRAKTVEAEYFFTNAGASPLTVQALSASCGGTVAHSAKGVCAPGETGSIKVTFDPSGRSGREEKTITVAFAEKLIPAQELKLVVDLPPAYSLFPRFLEWRMGEAATPKTLRFEKNPAVSWPLPEIVDIGPGFRVTAKATADAPAS